MTYRVLAINPGSTSTKIAVFEEENSLFSVTIKHPTEEIAKFASIAEQYDFRRAEILRTLEEKGVSLDFSAVVGRGGLIKPVEGGTYRVCDRMVEDLRFPEKHHASNLGGLIARQIADSLGVQSFIVDPVVVDELEPLARISGHPRFERLSIFHALNQKAIALRAAAELGRKYEESNFIVVHMGGGVSVGLHQQGRVVDVNNALDGDGPFSPERSGGLPIGQVIEACYSGLSKEEIKKMVVGKGGFVAYLDTNDGLTVEKAVRSGDEKARLVYEAMAYQVAKEIGALATVTGGKIDAILLTGGLVYDREYLAKWIEERVAFIAPVKVYPGEDEMLALAEGALRVLRGEAEAKTYRSEALLTK